MPLPTVSPSVGPKHSTKVLSIPSVTFSTVRLEGKQSPSGEPSRAKNRPQSSVAKSTKCAKAHCSTVVLAVHIVACECAGVVSSTVHSKVAVSPGHAMSTSGENDASVALEGNPAYLSDFPSSDCLTTIPPPPPPHTHTHTALLFLQ